jgi:hypothetical protein
MGIYNMGRDEKDLEGTKAGGSFAGFERGLNVE